MQNAITSSTTDDGTSFSRNLCPEHCRSAVSCRKNSRRTWLTAHACFLRLFLPCDALRCTVFVIVILSVRLSVRPSVCLSVTLVDCVHMVRPTIMISSPRGSPIILVSGDITYIPKFEEDHPERGRWMRVGWVRIGDFRPISRRISETVLDTTKVIINH